MTCRAGAAKYSFRLGLDPPRAPMAECALARPKEASGRSGGVLTPAAAFGAALIPQLEARAGLAFRIEG
ncbi:MAG: hypothetical protein ACE37J_05410 [Pikeienuella sp.]|uniref:hypothetical protein n=1 Tax=Pikeienuella sp. TaxID=2831957 RepID=UPI00391B8672